MTLPDFYYDFDTIWRQTKFFGFQNNLLEKLGVIWHRLGGEQRNTDASVEDYPGVWALPIEASAAGTHSDSLIQAAEADRNVSGAVSALIIYVFLTFTLVLLNSDWSQ